MKYVSFPSARPLTSEDVQLLVSRTLPFGSRVNYKAPHRNDDIPYVIGKVTLDVAADVDDGVGASPAGEGRIRGNRVKEQLRV